MDETLDGFFEIGIYLHRKDVNIGTLWRSAYQLGASGIFTIGRKYKKQSSDILHSYLRTPLRHYTTFEEFLENRPYGSKLVGVEMNGTPLKGFTHPEQCTYLLGAEDDGLPEKVLKHCHEVITLENINYPSYNVAIAGSIVMYHRMFL